ncbi:MAG TPA: EF-hand domain-containing protein [Candidatus Omnitrophota bacterium]|nr:EF-hand domain-containing protein [Candidatus Omnitrophota bacterium]
MSHLSLPLILFALVMGGAAYSQSGQSDQQAVAPPGPGGGRMPMMQQLDTDNDGSVSREEFMAGHQMRQQGYTAADTDKDGAISREEFMQAGQQRREERFRELDRDNDGRLTQAEMSDRASAMFRAMDANQDGKLSQDEIRMRQGKGPRP